MNKIKPLDLDLIEFKESPNQSNRASGQKPTCIVLHHTGPGTFNGIVSWLRNPGARASAHYVIGRKGEVVQLVKNEKRAWHAGISSWGGKNDVNQFSIGIELCNWGILNFADGKYSHFGGEYTGPPDPVMGSIKLNDGAEIEGFFVPYTEEQIEALVALCKALVIEWPEIKREGIITHYEIAVPQGRKNDPFGLDVEKVKNLIFG